ncbi:MAG TPA: 4-hydroxy-3-methylbut-2-enyl diphosphate reductase [Bacteroidales bacterium]|nr:4-hydroxy-3-methylbut-2-enyl diphosphate reductase [Bacteroidales bacterium]
MQVEIDRKSGFCFGVQNAVEIAERALLEGEMVYSLGSIVHNDMEVNRLKRLGLVSINHDEFLKLRDCKILIRAHGEPPETYLAAIKNNITIIEATCPIVKKLQTRIKDTWNKSGDNSIQLVIFGKPGHAEVIGLLGQIANKGILVSGPADLSKIDFTSPVHLFSQTTMSVTDYNKLIEAIREKYQQNGFTNPDKMFKASRTICGQVSNREPHLKEFASNHDVIIFVSGNESSNGKMLFQVCKSVNRETYFVTDETDLDLKWFEGKKSVGVCGATSTPKWLIKNISNTIAKI